MSAFFPIRESPPSLIGQAQLVRRKYSHSPISGYTKDCERFHDESEKEDL